MPLRRRAWIVVLCLAAGAALQAACGQPETDATASLRLATTTSPENSGLLTWLLEPFRAETGIDIQVVAVGTGQALELGKRGDADLVLVHDRTREDDYIAAGHAVERRDVMWNDFVLLGPPHDPAGVRGADDILDALKRIDAAAAPFVSRGDESGTHARERQLRSEAGLPPAAASDRWLDTGQGMGASLIVAAERGAYVLADRGTWLAFAHRLDLAIVRQGDASLRNPYGVLLLPPGARPAATVAAARRLADWMTGPVGQRRIGAFQVAGEVLFHPVHSD